VVLRVWVAGGDCGKAMGWIRGSGGEVEVGHLGLLIAAGTTDSMMQLSCRRLRGLCGGRVRCFNGRAERCS